MCYLYPAAAGEVTRSAGRGGRARRDQWGNIPPPSPENVALQEDFVAAERSLAVSGNVPPLLCLASACAGLTGGRPENFMGAVSRGGGISRHGGTKRGRG